MKYNYKAYNGTIINKYHVDTYNRLQDKINGLKSANMTVSEQLLNESHLFFMLITIK